MRDRSSLARRSAPGLALAAAVGLAACSGAQREGQGSNDEAFTAWSLPGVTLHRSCQEADDRSSCGVWGTDDASGARLSGVELFQRLPADTSADVLASRAQDLLLGRAGREALGPEAASASTLVTEAERSVITAPRLEGDVLVFYVLEGEMHPTAVELRIDRRSGTVERTNVLDVWVARASASGAPSCEPVVRCGCDDGCARVERVLLPDGSERYRRVDGGAHRVLYRVPASGSLEPVDEACTEACPPHAPTYSCTPSASGSASGCVVGGAPPPPPPPPPQVPPSPPPA
jgi:hypothetical protein